MFSFFFAFSTFHIFLLFFTFCSFHVAIRNFLFVYTSLPHFGFYSIIRLVVAKLVPFTRCMCVRATSKFSILCIHLRIVLLSLHLYYQKLLVHPYDDASILDIIVASVAHFIDRSEVN